MEDQKILRKHLKLAKVDNQENCYIEGGNLHVNGLTYTAKDLLEVAAKIEGDKFGNGVNSTPPTLTPSQVQLNELNKEESNALLKEKVEFLWEQNNKTISEGRRKQPKIPLPQNSPEYKLAYPPLNASAKQLPSKNLELNKWPQNSIVIELSDTSKATKEQPPSSIYHNQISNDSDDEVFYLDSEQKPENHSSHYTRKWETMGNNKSRNKKPNVNVNLRPVPIQGKNEKIVGIQAAENHEYTSLFLSGLTVCTTTQQVKQYLIDNGIFNPSCDILRTKQDKRYSSFKIGVPIINEKQALNPDLWPPGVKINKFLNLKTLMSQRKRQNQTPTS